MTLPMIPTWLNEFAPIGILLVVVGIVLARLPSVEGLNHFSSRSDAVCDKC